MKRYFLAFLLVFISNSYANSDSYYEQYPVGYISENVLYDLINQNRDKFRECHQQYLQKIPGAFDTLAIEFLIDPQGYAKPLKSDPASQPKEEAMGCLKSLIRSLKFPAPAYGVVFVRFESDVDLQNTTTIQSQELSRNAITLKPYMPRKIITSIVNMYMPYYRGCFKKPYIEKAEPGKITLRWNVSEEGRPTDIQVNSSQANYEKLSQCMIQVTEQQRYPSGYIKTSFEIVLNQ